MAGFPNAQVLLDDGSGTYPLDVTSYVEWMQAADISGVGRTDEFDEPQAATLTVVLDATDGTLTTSAGGGGGGGGFGLGGFGGGGFGLGGGGGGGISLFLGQGIRVVETFGATSVNSFTGVVDT